MEGNAPGRGKLKVTGILYIILGALGLLGSLILLVGGGLLMASGEESGAGVVLGAAAGILSLLGLIVLIVLLYLILGILGVKNCDKPEKCGANFALGVVVLVLVLVSLVANVMASGPTGAASNVIGLVLAIIYLLGAKQNKDAAAVKL